MEFKQLQFYLNYFQEKGCAQSIVVSTANPLMIQSSEILSTTQLPFIKLVVGQMLDLIHYFQTLLTLALILPHLCQLERNLILCWIQSIDILPRH